MFIAIGFMVLGGFLGFVFRKMNLRHISKVIMLLIWVLLFILGVEVGSNPQIVNGLGGIGVDALVITVGAVVGSAVMALLLWKHISRKGSSKR